jgi:hypothetical protein
VNGNAMRPALHLLRLSSLAPALLLAGCLSAAEEPKEPAEPWSESFTMVLQDRERTFVVRDRVSYLMMEAKDLSASGFLIGKEVCLPCKFDHTDGDHTYFFGFDHFYAKADLSRWANRLEGDNLLLFGVISKIGPDTVLTVRDLVVTDSDAQIVAKRLALVKPDQFSARMEVAAWARGEAEIQGNNDWWELAAGTIIADTVKDAAAAAEKSKDVALLSDAFGWAINELKDPPLAARVASQPWFVDQPQAIAAAKRLQALGYDRYHDVWRSRVESLTLQFEDRFAELPWRDADGFYKLGRWVDRHSEDLPRARDLSFRAYQAGYRADPSHAGIRRELGMAEGGGGKGPSNPNQNQLEGPFQDPTTGIVVGGPTGWQRSDTPDASARWLDLDNETSYLVLSVLRPDQVGDSLGETWDKSTLPWRVRPAFTEDLTESVMPPVGQGQRMHFHFQEGSDIREGDLILVFQDQPRRAVLLAASFLEQDRERAQAALLETLSKITIPALAPSEMEAGTEEPVEPPEPAE